MAPTLTEELLEEAIAHHQERVETLQELTLGEPVRTYARMLAEVITDEVIPTLEEARHCLDVLGELESKGLAEDDRILQQHLQHGINAARPFMDFEEETIHVG
jgi:hypothetical protein